MAVLESAAMPSRMPGIAALRRSMSSLLDLRVLATPSTKALSSWMTPRFSSTRALISLSSDSALSYSAIRAAMPPIWSARELSASSATWTRLRTSLAAFWCTSSSMA